MSPQIFQSQKYPGRHCMPSALPSNSCLSQSVATPVPLPPHQLKFAEQNC